MAAVIDPPSLPLYLYRYRSLAKFKRELEAVTTPYIYCGKFDKLNDPMEGFYRPSTVLKNKTDYDRVADLIYANKLNIGIASMSDTYENELMWTHYASNYSGICIEFYSHRLLTALPNGSRLVRMGYADQLPRISGNDVKDHLAAARKIFSQKKYNWNYEREWRVLGSVGQMNLSSKCIRGIYLGIRIKPSHKKTILKTFDGADVDIWEMSVDGYDHEWTRIQQAAHRRQDKPSQLGRDTSSRRSRRS